DTTPASMANPSPDGGFGASVRPAAPGAGVSVAITPISCTLTANGPRLADPVIVITSDPPAGPPLRADPRAGVSTRPSPEARGPGHLEAGAPAEAHAGAGGHPQGQLGGRGELRRAEQRGQERVRRLDDQGQLPAGLHHELVAGDGELD